MPSRRRRAHRLPPLKLGETPPPQAEPAAADTEPEADEDADAAEAAEDSAPTDGAANRAERRGLPPDHGHGFKDRVGKHDGRPAVSRQAFRHRSR